jgi:hypothetical protein
MISRTVLSKLVVLGCVLAPLLTWSQTPKPVMTGAEAALYKGTDRYDRLVEAAKKEGVVSVYHALPWLASTFGGVHQKIWNQS